MAQKPIPQLAPATALVQLLTAHPELPQPNWQISRHTLELEGDLQKETATFDALTAWAHALGGSIRPGAEFTSLDVTYRSHELLTEWQGVRVRIAVYVPLPVSDAYLAEGREAEWHHQLDDPAEPPAYVSPRPAAAGEAVPA